MCNIFLFQEVWSPWRYPRNYSSCMYYSDFEMMNSKSFARSDVAAMVPEINRKKKFQVLNIVLADADN